MSAFHAPGVVWDYLARCAAAERVLPIEAGFLDTEVTVRGEHKRFGDLTADDFTLLASAERQRITAETLTRLDQIGGAR